jgi:hypothetical protein
MAHYYELILTSDNKENLEEILSEYFGRSTRTWVDDVKIITRCEHGINLNLDECEEDCKRTSSVTK